MAADGRGLKLQGYENGFFVGGTVFDEVTPQVHVYRRRSSDRCSRSCAGPDFEDAMKLVNDHRYARRSTALATGSVRSSR
jgi:malonate-semialdehyde dehydrogenase (acetylating)/methylmalonate-semialdehyde dehydrogenase